MLHFTKIFAKVLTVGGDSMFFVFFRRVIYAEWLLKLKAFVKRKFVRVGNPVGK